jgi:hypothetical protein
MASIKNSEKDKVWLRTEKAYKFLFQKDSNQQLFSLQELSSECGWSVSTIRTYIDKNWDFVTKESKLYRCEGISRISLVQFRKLQSQLRKKVDDKVDLSLKKAKQFALTAVTIYNNPTLEVRAYSFIVNIIIAWTSMLHAFFYKEGDKPYYSEDKAWDLSECLKKVLQSGKVIEPEVENIKFLLELRHEIEHKDLPVLASQIEIHLQACLYNFERFLSENFDEESLNSTLCLSMQLSNSWGQQWEQEKNKAAYKMQGKFVKEYESNLSREIVDDIRFKHAIYVQRNVVNNKNKADEIISSDDILFKNEQDLSKGDKVIAIKEKYKFDSRDYKVSQIVEKVRERYPSFTVVMHTWAWKKYNARPTGKVASHEGKYSRFDKHSPIYLYNLEWAEFIVNNFNEISKSYKKSSQT